jgi:hypothetical protein
VHAKHHASIAGVEKIDQESEGGADSEVAEPVGFDGLGPACADLTRSPRDVVAEDLQVGRVLGGNRAKANQRAPFAVFRRQKVAFVLDRLRASIEVGGAAEHLLAGVVDVEPRVRQVLSHQHRNVAQVIVVAVPDQQRADSVELHSSRHHCRNRGAIGLQLLSEQELRALGLRAAVSLGVPRIDDPDLTEEWVVRRERRRHQCLALPFEVDPAGPQVAHQHLRARRHRPRSFRLTELELPVVVAREPALHVFAGGTCGRGERRPPKGQPKQP